MIHEINTSDFVLYKQEIRNAKDAYTARKVQKDRNKALRWVNLFLEDREIILTYKDNSEIKTVVATLKNDNPHRLPLPETDLVEEVIHGESVLEDQHVKFYIMPENIPVAIHIDQVVSFYISNKNVMEVSAKLNTPGRKYVKETVEE